MRYSKVQAKQRFQLQDNIYITATCNEAYLPILVNARGVTCHAKNCILGEICTGLAKSVLVPGSEKGPLVILDVGLSVLHGCLICVVHSLLK